MGSRPDAAQITNYLTHINVTCTAAYPVYATHIIDKVRPAHSVCRSHFAWIVSCAVQSHGQLPSKLGACGIAWSAPMMAFGRGLQVGTRC